MKKILCFGVWAMCLLFCSAATAATFGYSVQRCKDFMNAHPPQIDVIYSFGSLRLDNSKDAAGIKEVYEQLHFDRKERRFNGLTVMSPHAVVENTIGVEMIGDRLCYYPQRVTLNAGYSPVVYISKDLTNNRCRFMLTVRHEQTHLDIGHLSLQIFARRLKEKFPEIVESIGPVVKSQHEKDLSADNVAKEINEAYRAQLKVLFDDFVQKLLEENSRIDTDENYDAEQRLCPDI